MSDRALLEAAARAVGITLDFRIRGDFPPYYVNERGGHSSWNPLESDADALRLAVKLRLNITFTRGLGPGHKDEYMQVVPADMGHLAEFGPIGDDAGATIRRASNSTGANNE